MNFVGLKGTLKTNVKPAYLVHGGDIFLVQKAIDLITQFAGVKDTVLDVSRLGEGAGVDAIVAECRTVSFFGGRRVVVARPFGVEQLTAELKKYLEKPNPDCVLVLVGELPNVKNVEYVNCDPMSPDILVKLIANQVVAMGKKISKEAADLLCVYCVNTYARIDNEINKLVNYFTDIETIGVDEVKKICTKTVEYQVYELSKAICAGRIEECEEILRTLQDSGTEDYAIFGNLVSSFRRLFYSLTCKADTKDVAMVLGCSPYAVQYARRDNRHLANAIVCLYEYALDLEYQIKSGKVLVENAIVMLTMATISCINKA